MCYSAMAEEDLRRLSKLGATESIRRAAVAALADRGFPNDTKIRIRFTKALEQHFLTSADPADAAVKAAFERRSSIQRTELEGGLFKQRGRLVKAEHALVSKETKKALEERRIATDKVKWHMCQLAALDRTDLRDSDRRIYPKWYTMVIANVDDERCIMPMRYHCRQNGKPARIDEQFDGLYNARRDSLDGYWNKVWGKHHAVMVAWAFYENVALENLENRQLRPGEKSKNVVLEFRPRGSQPMLLACLWDKWEAPGEEPLYSFAAITDEPPPEVAAAGHDRCVIPIKPENLQAWLTPEGRSKNELQAILDDRVRHYYEHRKAA